MAGQLCRCAFVALRMNDEFILIHGVEHVKNLQGCLKYMLSCKIRVRQNPLSQQFVIFCRLISQNKCVVLANCVHKSHEVRNMKLIPHTITICSDFFRCFNIFTSHTYNFRSKWPSNWCVCVCVWSENFKTIKKAQIYYSDVSSFPLPRNFVTHKTYLCLKKCTNKLLEIVFWIRNKSIIYRRTLVILHLSLEWLRFLNNTRSLNHKSFISSRP
jgi:hypothetical protein